MAILFHWSDGVISCDSTLVMPRNYLTDDEADSVMANIHPQNRRWCPAGCGIRPGIDDPNLNWGCACSGCLYGALSWEEFQRWQEREAQREPTPYIDWYSEPNEPPMHRLTLQERLASYKARKRS